jgi:hypothetical protein
MSRRTYAALAALLAWAAVCVVTSAVVSVRLTQAPARTEAPPEPRMVAGDPPPAIVNDGVTDNAATIQAWLDYAAASPTDKVVQLPPGKIAVSRPLLIEGPATLAGTRGGGTELIPTWGSGPTVVARSPRPLGPTLVPSLAAGPGAGLRLGAGRGRVFVSDGTLDLSEQAALTVGYFFRREAAAPEAAVHFQLGAEYGVDSFASVGVWDWFGGLKVFWGGAGHDIPGVCQGVGVTYYVELAYTGSAVTVYVGEPGQPAAAVKTWAYAGPVPCRPDGLEVLAIGFNARGPAGDLASHDGPEAVIDGIAFSSHARPAGPFACPTAKPEADEHALFVLNFETQGPFLVGRTGARGPGFGQVLVLPDSGVDLHLGGVAVRDITIMGQGGASGLLLCDAIFAEVERVGFVKAWQGVCLRGTTFGGEFRRVHGDATSMAWVQCTQSMMTNAANMNFAADGIVFYARGAVGGCYEGVHLSPYAGTYTAAYLGGAEVDFFGGQVDAEGQEGPGFRAAMICDACTPGLHGYTLARKFAGPLVRCGNGGSVNLFGGRTVATEGAEPLIHFHAEPDRPAVLVGVKLFTPQAVSNNPDWVVQPGFELGF